MFIRFKNNLFVLLCIIISLISCTTHKFKPTSKLNIVKNYSFVATSFDKIPNWDNQNFIDSLDSFKKSCIKLISNPKWKNICLESENNLNNIQAKIFFEKNFIPWTIKENNKIVKGLSTGYYQPIIKGSLAKKPHSYFPIYGIPKDLIIVPIDSKQRTKSFINIEIIAQNKAIIKSNGKYKANLKDFYLPDNINYLNGRIEGNNFVPYYSRSQINSGILKNKAPILAYAEDPIDLFFLHIQGSGIIKTENGYIKLNFANKNGLPYKSIAKYMDSKGYLPLYKVNKNSIKNWLKKNPYKLSEILAQNPSYIFFYISNNNEVIGSLGVPLTAKYSAAVDNSFIQLGSPIFISTTNPEDNTIKLNKLIMAQDTGSAITGAVRIDYFLGTGEEADKIASKMKYDTYIWILVPKDQHPQTLNDNA